MRLQRLSARLDYLFGGYDAINITHPLFASITHLDTGNPILLDDTQIIPQLPKLPALTHLCFNDETPWAVAEAVLADCPRLAVLAVHFHCTYSEIAYKWAAKSPVDDMRFVVALYADYEENWKAAATGWPNF
jgi:hypothetical protein